MTVLQENGFCCHLYYSHIIRKTKKLNKSGKHNQIVSGSWVNDRNYNMQRTALRHLKETEDSSLLWRRQRCKSVCVLIAHKYCGYIFAVLSCYYLPRNSSVVLGASFLSFFLFFPVSVVLFHFCWVVCSFAHNSWATVHLISQGHHRKQWLRDCDTTKNIVNVCNEFGISLPTMIVEDREQICDHSQRQWDGNQYGSAS